MTVVALASLSLSAACLEPAGPAPGPDAGAVDEACLAASGEDSGVLATACDPTDGTRCDLSRHQACVWDVIEDLGACRCSSVRVALDAPCDLARQDCALGAACLFFANDDLPRCRGVCALEDGAGCEGPQGLAPEHAFACAPVRRGPDARPTEAFGVCVDVGRACDPLQDRCPAAEACGLLGRVTACAARGAVGLGGSCVNQACDRGGLCVALADAAGNQIPPTCYQPCDIVNPDCMSGACADVGLAFGL